jgi:hypothetical protein
MLTDFALAGVAWWLARAMLRSSDSRATALWALSFAVTGVAAVMGGSVHGFGMHLPAPVTHALRTVTVMSVGVGSTGLLAGAVYATVRPGPVRRLLLGVCGLKLAAYLAWVALHPDFRYARYDALPSVLLLLGFLAGWWRRSRSPAAASGLLGLLVSVAGAVLQHARIGIHPFWLSHNDLYHVVQAGALWLLHVAGRELRDAR